MALNEASCFEVIKELDRFSKEEEIGAMTARMHECGFGRRGWTVRLYMWKSPRYSAVD
jgi:hypothetical protein